MKVKVIKRPIKLSKSNANWLQIADRFNKLNLGQCLKITGLTHREIGSLRREAYREVRLGTFFRLEANKPVLYLYKRGEG